MNYVFRVNVQVEPMQGSQLPDDCAGAYVDVYIGASNIREAIDDVESELLADCYKPKRTCSAVEIDLDSPDLEADAESAPTIEEFLHIQDSGEIFYGEFHCYPPEKGDIQ
ncbi:MAG: hypothetical protein V7459_12130 [Oceanicoccus sp.]